MDGGVPKRHRRLGQSRPSHPTNFEMCPGLDESGVPLLGVGRFESERFEPWLWKPAYPWEPFNHTDRFDAFWAAKIVARFSEEHIQAAVDAGQPARLIDIHISTAEISAASSAAGEPNTTRRVIGLERL